MPSKVVTVQGEHPEGQDIWTLARVVGADGSILTSSVVTAWDLRAYDLSSLTPSTAILTQTGEAVSNVIVAIVADGYWDVDDIGYNFRRQTTAANLPTVGGRTYRLEFKLTTTIWGFVYVVHETTARSAVH